MKRLLTAIAALAALACAGTSCQKEFGQDTNNDKFTVTAVIEAGRQTKMSYEDQGLKPVWTPNTDIIIGFDESGNTYGYNVTSVSSDGKAVLEIITDGENVGSATTNPAEGTKMYMFYAPGKKPGDISNKTLTVDISSQSADVAPALMMSTAVVENNSLSLTFTNETVVIGIKTPTMASSTTTYDNITLTSNVTLNNQVKFDLSGDNGALKATYSQAVGVTSITKDVNLTGTEASGKTIFLVACPVTDADLIFTANHIGGKEVTTRTGKTLAAGNYYYINSPSFNTQRTITITFDDATKAIFGDNIASTLDDAEVKVANGDDDAVTCPITVSGTTATITTNLIGDLTLVYPADAAKMNGNEIDGVLVSTAQDGTLAGSLIAMATVAADASTAEFSNQTAVFKVTPPTTGTTKLEVSADKDLANETVSEYTDTKKIHVHYDDGTPEFYIATLVPSGLKLNELTFNNGSKTKTETAATDIQVNNLYTITSDNWQAPQRTITLSFSQATIDLFGSTYTPAFDDSKKVQISNGTASAECDITVNGGTATITTNLEGPLTAVYPSTAAKMNGNSIDGVNVSTVQDGVLDADIIAAMATIAEDGTTAEFTQQTAIFVLTPGTVNYLELSTTTDAAASGKQIANKTETGYPDPTKIRVNVGTTPSAAQYYISILVPTGLNLVDLRFFNGKYAKSTMNMPVIKSTLYTVGSSGWSKFEVEDEEDAIVNWDDSEHYQSWD